MPEHPSDNAGSVMSRSRLEFLFDGVFAIAMTILVLEIKVPELVDRRSARELASALLHHGTTFLSYLLSFGMLGLFWYRHQHFYRFVVRITKTVLVVHLVIMATAAFFPFCAALFGRHATNPLTLVVYAGCILVYVSSMALLWTVGEKQGILDPALDRSVIRRHRNRYVRGALVILVLVFASLVQILR